LDVVPIGFLAPRLPFSTMVIIQRPRRLSENSCNRSTTPTAHRRLKETQQVYPEWLVRRPFRRRSHFRRERGHRISQLTPGTVTCVIVSAGR
jgi:hypothetical protein